MNYGNLTFGLEVPRFGFRRFGLEVGLSSYSAGNRWIRISWPAQQEAGVSSDITLANAAAEAFLLDPQAAGVDVRRVRDLRLVRYGLFGRRASISRVQSVKPLRLKARFLRSEGIIEMRQIGHTVMATQNDWFYLDWQNSAANYDVAVAVAEAQRRLRENERTCADLIPMTVIVWREGAGGALTNVYDSDTDIPDKSRVAAG